jgi:hypothetical protein
MARDDWYRRSTWSAADQEDFFARLKRSRTVESKSQHLRIQACHLAKAGLHAEAADLLDQFFREFADRTELAIAHLQKAQCMIELNRTEAAINEFRASLQAERDFPNSRTGCWLDFPWFIVRQRNAVLYDEALSVLQEFVSNSDLMFPIERYKYWTVLALISESRGDNATAKASAISALECEAMSHSGFRYHPDVGLVNKIDAEIHNRLVVAAGRQEGDATVCDR